MSPRTAPPAPEVPAHAVIPEQRVAVPDNEEAEIDDPCPGCGGPVRVLVGGAHCGSEDNCGWLDRW